MMHDADKTSGNFIDKQGGSFIASISADGFPNMKAMLPPCKRVAQYRENPKASIYFCDKRFFRGVMLAGHMEALEDSASKEMIWREGDTMYFPGGVTAPGYCVLKFVAESGRYYTNFHSESFDVGGVEPIENVREDKQDA